MPPSGRLRRAPHPAFGHPLPAGEGKDAKRAERRARGAEIDHITTFVPVIGAHCFQTPSRPARLITSCENELIDA